ncbi:unnamed protein product, partial [marine sediment metagenome]
LDYIISDGPPGIGYQRLKPLLELLVILFTSEKLPKAIVELLLSQAFDAAWYLTG